MIARLKLISNAAARAGVDLPPYFMAATTASPISVVPTRRISVSYISAVR
jgi:hypothetical protein